MQTEKAGNGPWKNDRRWRWASTASPPDYRLVPFSPPSRVRKRSLTCVEISGERLGEALHSLVVQLRVVAPWQPIVGIVDPEDLSLMDVLNARPARFGLRGVVSVDRPIEPQARKALSNIDHWPDDLALWLPGAIQCRREAAQLLVDLVRIVDRPVRIATMARALSCSESTLKRTLRRSDLPSPTRIGQLSVALHASAALQRSADISQEQVARMVGLSDASGLHRMTWAAFGVTPGYARQSMGFEELMVRWCQGIVPSLSRVALTLPPTA